MGGLPWKIMCTIDHRICWIPDARYEFQLVGGIRFNNHANSLDRSWWQWVGSKPFMLLAESRVEVACGSLECRAFIQLDTSHRPKIINFFWNHWHLILPADICQPIQGCIWSNWWTAHFSPMPNAGMELNHWPYQNALGIQHSISTSQGVKLVKDCHLQLPQSIPCCLSGTGQEKLDAFSCWLFPNTQWMPVICVTNQQFKLSLYTNQFLLTCKSGKAELLSTCLCIQNSDERS